ncbi:MAG TPA: DUF742 domain-containing protein [Streptosporangiaceae bacterium]|nr:DUF742 domain-containing protein [Streptosporangiaceae bacterium]
MTSGGEQWLDREAGPVVRPYALIKGRTRPPSTAPGLIDVVTAAGEAGYLVGLGPEHRRLLSLCRKPVAVADLASDTDLPLGVVRVLLGDLRERRLIVVAGSADQDSSEESVLRSVLDGLRAL